MGLLFAALYKEKPADYALLASNQYNAQRLYEFLLNFLSEDEVVFFPAARSVTRLSGERLQKRIDRLRVIAQSACEQCGRKILAS